MEERRRIDRVGYQAKSVIVVCDTGESIFVETRNVSPLGIRHHNRSGYDDHVCRCHQTGGARRRKF